MSNVDSLFWRAVVPWALPLALVIGYLVGTLMWPSPFFPPVVRIAEAFGRTWFGDGLARNVAPSLTNLTIGYLAGLVLGVGFGALLGRLRAVNQMFSPVLGFFLTIPPVAMIPVFLFIVGIGQQFQISLIVFGTMCYMLLSTAAAVQAIEPTLDDMCRVFRLSAARRVFLVIYPAALPRIIASARVSLAAALLIMVVSEMVGVSGGIGAITLTAQQAFDYPQMWAGIVLVAVLGIVFSYVFAVLEKLVGRLVGESITMEGV